MIKGGAVIPPLDEHEEIRGAELQHHIEEERGRQVPRIETPAGHQERAPGRIKPHRLLLLLKG